MFTSVISYSPRAEYLSLGLVQKGHEVIVYNSHAHPYQEEMWNGVRIVHCYDPEERMGTVGQFIYDFNCILDSRKRNVDIILQLGYTSSSVWGWLLPRSKSIVTTNMDGLEWKRTKYSRKIQKFLLYAEKLGVRFSDYLISDSIGIQQYLQEKYQKPSVFIPYGAHIFTSPEEFKIYQYGVKSFQYDMLIARLEPENSIEMILDGVVKCNTQRPFLVIGKHETKFGAYLKEKFKTDKRIMFIGGIYDINILNNLRHFSNLYFHGHTVGGTNPSLLEAMASQSLICAHSNIFNQSILGSDAFYFSNSNEVQNLLDQKVKSSFQNFITNNEKKIEQVYDWDIIVDQYLHHFEEIMAAKKS